MKRKVYVASSWRNEKQPEIVEAIRAAGHEVYDFRNPPHCNGGFHWSDIDPNWQQWTPAEFRESLTHPIALSGFSTDLTGMMWADACVLVMPCGRSAHLEAGWFIGAGKLCLILLSDGEPELMYGLAERCCVTIDEVIYELDRRERLINELTQASKDNDT